MRVDVTSYKDTTNRVVFWALSGKFRYVCVGNAHIVMEAFDSEDFRKIAKKADIVTPDGMPLVLMLLLIMCFVHTCFEHLYPYQAIFCLKETFRVLKKGGVVRIGVPDLDKIVQHYDSQHPECFLEAIFESKQKYNKNKHHWHYNEISLTRILKEIGFSKIYRCEFRKGQCADVTHIDNRPESLFMEAVK